MLWPMLSQTSVFRLRSGPYIKPILVEILRIGSGSDAMVQEDPDALLKGEEDPFDFPKIAADMGIECIELVNTFYMSKADDMDYWAKFKQNCEDSGCNGGADHV